MGKLTEAFAEFGSKRKVFIRKANGTYYAKKGSIDIPKLESDISGINTDISALEANALPTTSVADNDKFLKVGSGKWNKSSSPMTDYVTYNFDGSIYYMDDETPVDAGYCWWKTYDTGLVEIDGYVEYTIGSVQTLGNGWYYKYTPLLYLPDELGLEVQLSSTATLMKGHTVAFVSSENHDLPNTTNCDKLQYLILTYGNGSSVLTKYTIGFHILGSINALP